VANASAIPQVLEMSLGKIKNAMNDTTGVLKLANTAITRLRWIDQAEKSPIPPPTINGGQSESNAPIEKTWPILLGGVIALILIIAALVCRRKWDRFQKLDDDFNRLSDNTSDIEFNYSEPDHWLDVPVSTIPVPTLMDGLITDTGTDQVSSSDVASVEVSQSHHNDQKAYHDEVFLGFIKERQHSSGLDSWDTPDDTSCDVSEEDRDYLKQSQSFSGLGSEMVQLRNIHPLLRARSADTYVSSSTSFVMDDSGRLFDPSLICSICNKSMEGMARKFCACGKEACSLSAHMLCVLEKYPLPSVSHPGTPPTMLPIVLCRYRPKS
jgi:hypothetical protein